MERLVKKECLNELLSSKKALIVYSLTEEAEAIANACHSLGIKVSAFCDNEIRKSQKSVSSMNGDTGHTGKAKYFMCLAFRDCGRGLQMSCVTRRPSARHCLDRGLALRPGERMDCQEG